MLASIADLTDVSIPANTATIVTATTLAIMDVVARWKGEQISAPSVRMWPAFIPELTVGTAAIDLIGELGERAIARLSSSRCQSAWPKTSRWADVFAADPRAVAAHASAFRFDQTLSEALGRLGFRSRDPTGSRDGAPDGDLGQQLVATK